MSKHYLDGADYPTIAPMRYKIKPNGEMSMGDKHYYHSSNFISDLYTFLDGHIGKNFDETFKKFCERYPKHVERYNTRAEFLGAFKEHDFKKAGCYEYWVDENNNIQKGERYKAPRKTVKKYYDDYPLKEVICPNTYLISKCPQLQQYIYGTLGKEAFNTIMTVHEIPKTQFDSFIRRVNSDYYFRSDVESIAKEHLGMSETWRRGHINSIFNQLFPAYEYRKFDTLYEGTNEYKQYIKEQEDAKRKAERERKKERNEYLDNLLWTIEQRKKIAARVKDIIDRDRLGFDEQSFIGEPYHGQKRKKKGV